MPPRRPPADPTKQNPTGVRPARNGKRWVLAGTVGDFTADAVPTKRDTTVLTKQEKDAGLTKLDRDTKIRAGKLERRERADASGPVVPGGGRGRSERP